MGPLSLLAHPRVLVGGATVVVSVLAGLYAFGQGKGELPVGVWLLVPVVILAVLGLRTEKAGRGWLYILISWAFGLIAYGALFPGAWSG